ncbi:MAG: hypothetical protein ACXU95_12470 [Isosphaeraceae bacterium]
MPHPYVDKATMTNGKITFRVEVTDLQTTQGAIEITGEATQANGAFAPISCVTNIPSAPNGEGEDAGRYFVDVNADPNPNPDNPFKNDQDITIFVRVSKVWVTVLGPGTDEVAPRTNESPTWGKRRADAQIIPQEGGY